MQVDLVTYLSPKGKYIAYLSQATIETFWTFNRHSTRQQHYTTRVAWRSLPCWSALLNNRIQDNRPEWLRLEGYWATREGHPTVSQSPYEARVRPCHIRIDPPVVEALIRLAAIHNVTPSTIRSPVANLIGQFLEALANRHLVIEKEPTP